MSAASFVVEPNCQPPLVRRGSAAYLLKRSIFVEAQLELVESGGVGNRPAICEHRLEFGRVAVASVRVIVGL